MDAAGEAVGAEYSSMAVKSASRRLSAAIPTVALIPRSSQGCATKIPGHSTGVIGGEPGLCRVQPMENR